jgi:hypothetical protein
MAYEDENRTAISTSTMEQVPLSEIDGGREDSRRSSRGQEEKAEVRGPRKEIPVAVVEQRVSNLAQGVLCKSQVGSADSRSYPDDQALPDRIGADT